MSKNDLTQKVDVSLECKEVSTVSRSLHQMVRRIRPKVNSTIARKLVESLYGFTPEDLTELEGYVDRNYFVNAQQLQQNLECHSAAVASGYVLKIINSEDTKTNHVEAEHEVMRALLDQGFKCPQPVLNIYGQDKSIEKIYYECEEGDGNQQQTDLNGKIIGDHYAHGHHVVHMLKFVPGKTMGQVIYTPSLLFQAGRQLGQLHEALKDFSHPGLELYQFFNLDSVPDLRDYTHAISNTENRALVTEVMRQFTKEILPKRHLFQRGVIHGDFGVSNIVVQESLNPNDTIDDLPVYDIYGIIDFGYVAKSYYVYDLGIAIMYAMLDSTVVDPLHVGGHILAGYLTEMQLCEVEIESVLLCVAARFAQSLTMGAYSYTLEPTNEYILLTSRNGWTRLKQLWSTSRTDIYDAWMRVMSECYATTVVPC